MKSAQGSASAARRPARRHTSRPAASQHAQAGPLQAWWWALWLACLAALVAPVAAQAPAAGGPPHFAARDAASPLSLGPEVLTPAERDFIARLPEIRVAIPLPPVRPYEVVNDQHEVSGIHPEMLGYLARAFGLKVRPVLWGSFSDALAAVRRREADLMMTLGYTAERAEYLEYTLGVTPLPGALFARRGQPAAGERELAHARFAIERDFLANTFVRRQYPQATIVTVETTDEALAAVADGRADYYLGALLTTIDWLDRKPVPGIEVNRLLSYSSGHYHFAVRKDWAPLAAVLNRGISTLRASGVSPALRSPQWRAAAASVPGGQALPRTLELAPRELELLVARPVWRVGAVRGLPLLNHVEPGGTHSGIAAEFTEQVAQRLGIGVQVVAFTTAGEMLDALRRGEIDLVPFITRTPERERDFAFTRPYVVMPYVIVARFDAPAYWGLDSLRGRRLALPALHPLRPRLTERYRDIQLVTVADSTSAMDLVAAGGADAAIEVKLLANQRIHGEADDRLRTVAVVEEVPAEFHMATARAAAPLAALVDRALQDIPEAERERMRRRWVAVDLSAGFPWRRHLPVIATAAAALLALALGTAWWLRRLSREVAARRRSEERLRDIAATLPCVAFRHVFAVDGSLVGSYVSPGAEAVIGVAQAPGRTILQSMLPRLRDEQRLTLERDEREALDAGGHLRTTVAYRHPDGRERWLSCEAVCTAAEGAARAWTGYIADVTAEHEMQQRLTDAAEARNVMLASASHELRAPAHTLALALQALQTVPPGRLAPQQHGALRIAQDAVDTLSQLLGDVLDAARFDGAPLALRPREVALHDLLQLVAEAAAAQAAAKGLTFECRVAPEVPERVRADPLRLKQVLVNLLSNAFKYTPRGGVALQVDVDRGHGAPRLVLVVQDSGPGLPESVRARLFTPFTTGDDTAPQPEGSSGLGLAICRRLAALMEGGIDIHSGTGGTRATLWLPLHEGALPAPALPARDGAVLVCDDDPTSRMLLLHLLQEEGFAVAEADAAAAALARWREGGIAALVTDLEMPGGDSGVVLMRTLREAAAAAGTPCPLLVVCSGDAADPARPGEADRLADARFVKPVRLPELVRLLVRHGVPRRAVAPAP